MLIKPLWNVSMSLLKEGGEVLFRQKGVFELNLDVNSNTYRDWCTPLHTLPNRLRKQRLPGLSFQNSHPMRPLAVS